MVKLINKWLTAVSALTLGAGSAVGQELTAAQCENPSSLQIEAECACQLALEEDTIEALETFIREYGEYDSACRVLAFNALERFTPGGGNDALTSGDRDPVLFSVVPGYGGGGSS